MDNCDMCYHIDGVDFCKECSAGHQFFQDFQCHPVPEVATACVEGTLGCFDDMCYTFMTTATAEVPATATEPMIPGMPP